MKKPRALLVIVAFLTSSILAVVLSASPAAAAMLINAAGSTFGYPIYSRWFSEYTKVNPNVRFNYQSIGSGGGVNMLKDRTVEIGASDAPLNQQQLSSMPAKTLEFPTVLGAVAITYNLPDVTGELRLTGPVIADIFMGTITQWNDPALEKLNPSLKLPNRKITLVHRSDGSGDTYIFSDYLSKISPAWAKEVGKSTALRWPAGLGGKGNEGVTALVKQTPYSIGYVTLIYAIETQMPVASLKNPAGKFVTPSLHSVTAAAAGAAANMPADFRVSITNAPGAHSYPLSSFTWMIIYQEQTNPTKGQAVKDFLHWMLVKGQGEAAALNYAPLPLSVVKLELKELNQIQIVSK